jgi:hypothetical protein
MKKLIVLTAFLGMVTTGTFAQQETGKQTKSAKAEAKYCCIKCHACANKPGKCAKCGAETVKVGDYYCPSCGATSSKSGECKKCQKEMIKMTASK